MISSFLYNFPFVLFFLPLLVSILICIIDNKKIDISLFLITIGCMGLLLLFGILNFHTNTNIFVNIKNNISLIGGEFRLNVFNLYFAFLILMTHLIIFLHTNYEIIGRKTKNASHRKYFFAVYLLNIFSIIGILFSSNLCNYFLFLEIYSFTMYTLTSDFNDKSMAVLSFKSFSNNICGSIIILLSIFALILYFNSNNILFIQQKLLTMDIYRNLPLLIIMFLYIFGIYMKFFASNIHIALSDTNKNNYMKTSFLSLLILFVNAAIGIYCLLFFTINLFNITDAFKFLSIKYFAVSLMSFSVLYLIYKIFRNLTVGNLVKKLIFINITFIIICILTNNQYSTYLAFLFLIEHFTIHLSMFLIANVLESKYGTTKLEVFRKETDLQYLFIFLLLLKIGLPLCLTFFINIDLINFINLEKLYLLYIPFFAIKIILIYYLCKIFMIKTTNITELELNEFSQKRVIITKCILYGLIFMTCMLMFALPHLKMLINM